ncbi:hypothetical protein [Bradyrhizobium guangzhouense]|uniref:hypothetical protein n=1 Tax=Bradyrhizobium guangzhouense TaxID=1325095 RepID=UPI001009DE15|nr:hypothetical protein [Bradyrhizobium guangzhouense]
MRSVGVTAILAALFSVSPAWPQSAQLITVGRDTFAFHEEKFRDLNMKMEAPVTADAEILVELVGLPNVAKINALKLQIRRIYGLKNAVALEGGGYRTIAYDPEWASGETPGFYLALGHEAGHHFCGHSIGEINGDRLQIELEADQFGGAAIRRFEVYHGNTLFAQVFAAAAAKYPEQGSSLYPPRASRLAALRLGYEQGSRCGDLAPVVQPGFVPSGRATGAGPCRPVRTGPTSYTCEH